MKCVVFAGMPVSPSMREYCAGADFVIAADAGYETARGIGIEPDLLIGDYDSAPFPKETEKTIRLPAEKDDTDTLCAVKKALERNADEILILGGLGGRFDHTLANLQTLIFLAQKGVKALLADEANEITVLTPGEYRFAACKGWYYSFFSIGSSVENLTLEGFKYPLSGGRLTNGYPLGVSNEPAQKELTVRFEKGMLFFVKSRMERTGE